MPPRRKQQHKPKVASDSSQDMRDLLKDIKAMEEPGAVARLAALRFKLPVYPSRNSAEDGLPSQVHDPQVFDAMDRTLQRMWDTGSEKLQAGVCIMLGRLALDDNLREKLQRTDWLRRVSAAIPSSRPANSLSALNAFAELLEGKGGLCLEGKVDVKSLSNHLFGMAQHGEENTVAAPLALRTLSLLSTMCCDCTIKSIDGKRLIKVMLSSAASPDPTTRELVMRALLLLRKSHAEIARADPALLRFMVGSLRGPEPFNRIWTGMRALNHYAPCMKELSFDFDLDVDLLEADPEWSAAEWTKDAKKMLDDSFAQAESTGDLRKFGVGVVKALEFYDRASLVPYGDRTIRPRMDDSLFMLLLKDERNNAMVFDTIDYYRQIDGDSYVAVILHLKLLCSLQKHAEVVEMVDRYHQKYPKRPLMCEYAASAALRQGKGDVALHWAKKGITCKFEDGPLRCELLTVAHVAAYVQAEAVLVELGSPSGPPKPNFRELAVALIVSALEDGKRAIATLPLDHPDRLDLIARTGFCQLMIGGSSLSPNLTEMDDVWRAQAELLPKSITDMKSGCACTAELQLCRLFKVVRNHYAAAAAEWDPMWKRLTNDGKSEWTIPVLSPGHVPTPRKIYACDCCGEENAPIVWGKEIQVFGGGTVLLRRCLHCNKASSALLRCSKCHIARYCNVKCQTADWRNHRKLCKPNDGVEMAWFRA